MGAAVAAAEAFRAILSGADGSSVHADAVLPPAELFEAELRQLDELLLALRNPTAETPTPPQSPQQTDTNSRSSPAVSSPEASAHVSRAAALLAGPARSAPRASAAKRRRAAVESVATPTDPQLMLRLRVVQWLRELCARYLRPPTALPLHEVRPLLATASSTDRGAFRSSR